MKHRINDHPEKVKDCKYGDICSFSLCWYKHRETVPELETLQTSELNTETTETNAAGEDFQKGQMKQKPPLGKSQ